MLLKQSTAFTRIFDLGIISLTVNIQISKAGASLANPAAGSSNLTEIGRGLYSFALQSADTDTLGDLGYALTDSATNTTIYQPASGSVDQIYATTLDDIGGTLPIGHASGTSSGLLIIGDNSAGSITFGATTINGGMVINGTSAGNGLTINGGNSSGANAGHAVSITGGLCSSGNGNGGSGVVVVAGSGHGSGNGGNGVDVSYGSGGGGGGVAGVYYIPSMDDLVLDVAASGHTTSGTIGAFINNIGGAVASVTGAVGSVTGDVQGKVLGGGASSFTAIGVQAFASGAIPTATAGAAGGLLIAGTNAPTSFVSTNQANSALTITGADSSGGNPVPALIITGGNGGSTLSGTAVSILGGASAGAGGVGGAPGLSVQGGACTTSGQIAGPGVLITGGGDSSTDKPGVGLKIIGGTGNSNFAGADAVVFIGTTSTGSFANGHALKLVGSSSTNSYQAGSGLYIVGGNNSGNTGQGGDAISLVGGNASNTGNGGNGITITAGNCITIAGGNGGHGIYVTSGNGLGTSMTPQSDGNCLYLIAPSAGTHSQGGVGAVIAGNGNHDVVLAGDHILSGSLSGDVGGKVLGGGSSTITGDGVQATSVTLAASQPNAITFAQGIVINQSNTNQPALALTGNGSGSGLQTEGGFGIYCQGSNAGFLISSAGNGISVSSGINALDLYAASNAIYAQSTGADAILVYAGTTSAGLHVWGGQTSGDAITLSTSGSGSTLVPANTASINGNSLSAQLLALVYAGFETGTAQAGGSGDITLRTGASAVDDYYKDQALFILSGTGTGQTNRISSYVGSTKVATVETAWATQPDNTSIYVVLGRVG